MILYSSLTSTYGFRIRMVLKLKGIEAEIRPPPDGYRSAAYKQIFPTGLVPVLVDGDLTLGEADVIAQYLDETYPDPPLMPATPAGRAKVRLLARYHDLYLEAALKLAFPLLPQKERDPAQVQAAEAALNQRLEEVDRLAVCDPFLAGPTLTLADLAHPSTIAAAEVVAKPLGIALNIPPRLQAWRAELARHPVVAPMLADYRAVLDKWLEARLAGVSPLTIKVAS